MSHTPDIRSFIAELRELLKRHDAVILGNPADEDCNNIILEVSAHGSTVIFLDTLTPESKGQVMKNVVY